MLACFWQMIIRMLSKLTISARSRMKMAAGYGIGTRGSTILRSR